MTEQEARNRWCPFMFGADSDGGQLFNCQGSDCMAWRWGKVERFGAKNLHGGRHIVYEESTTDGYCGLAGES